MNCKNNRPPLQVWVERAGRDPQQMLERDNSLILKAGVRGGNILRLWENRNCLVVGRQVTRRPGYDRGVKKMQSIGWPVLVRESGGTAVPHYSGVLNISLIVPLYDTQRSFGHYYRLLCGAVVDAIRKLGVEADVGAVPGAYCDGDYNIRINGRKVAGTAQRVKRITRPDGESQSMVLLHACINTVDAGLGVRVVRDFAQSLGGDEEPPLTEAHIDLAEALLPLKRRYRQPDLVHSLVDSVRTRLMLAYHP